MEHIHLASKLVLIIKHAKSDANIGLFSHHIVHGAELYEHLSVLFNCMIIHGISPFEMRVLQLYLYPREKVSMLMYQTNIVEYTK